MWITIEPICQPALNVLKVINWAAKTKWLNWFFQTSCLSLPLKCITRELHNLTLKQLPDYYKTTTIYLLLRQQGHDLFHLQVVTIFFVVCRHQLVEVWLSIVAQISTCERAWSQLHTETQAQRHPAVAQRSGPGGVWSAVSEVRGSGGDFGADWKRAEAAGGEKVLT